MEVVGCYRERRCRRRLQLRHVEKPPGGTICLRHAEGIVRALPEQMRLEYTRVAVETTLYRTDRCEREAVGERMRLAPGREKPPAHH